VYKTKRFI